VYDEWLGPRSELPWLRAGAPAGAAELVQRFTGLHEVEAVAEKVTICNGTIENGPAESRYRRVSRGVHP
jgi:hypothetical protein